MDFRERAAYGQGAEIPARIEPQTLDAQIAGERAGDLGYPGRAIEDILGGLVMVANLKMAPDINRGRDASTLH